jgi:hypothetical protein
MEAEPRTPEETYGPALAKALAELQQGDPRQMAHLAGCSFEEHDDGRGNISVPIFGTLHDVGWPGGEIQRAADKAELDIASRIVLLHHLLTADGTPLAGEWIAFRSLPGGLGYDAAFRGRSSMRIARTFGKDRHAFNEAASLLRGERLGFGDSSFLFRVLPRVWMAVVLHLADDEFPAEANVLFDASASHYLPTEDLAVLGGILASRLAKGKP